MGNLKLGVSQNRLCDFLADPDSRIFSRFTLIFTGAGSSMVLYYMPNSSSTAQPPPGAEHFAATRTKVPSHAKTVHFLYRNIAGIMLGFSRFSVRFEGGLCRATSGAEVIDSFTSKKSSAIFNGDSCIFDAGK